MRGLSKASRMSGVTLETLSAKLDLVLDESRKGILGDVFALREINDTMVSIHRSVRALDRRISNAKSDIELALRELLDVGNAIDATREGRL